MLLNDVKLRLMQADAWVSTVNEKLLCDDDAAENKHPMHDCTYTKHTCKPKDTE